MRPGAWWMAGGARKPEFWITKKLHSPVKLKEGPIAPPAAGETLRLPVENQYDFTDLSELRVEWQIGAEQGLAQATGHAAPDWGNRNQTQPSAGVRAGPRSEDQGSPGPPGGCLPDSFRPGFRADAGPARPGTGAAADCP